MSNFIQNIAKSRALTIGLGLLATSAPVFAQATSAPTTPPTAPPATATPPASDLHARVVFAQTVERYRALKNLTTTYSSSGRTQLIEFRAPQIVKVTSLDDKGQMAALQVFTDTESIVMQKPNDVFEYVSTPRAAAPEGQTPRSRLAKTTLGGLTFSSLLAGLDPFGDGGRFKATSYTLAAPTEDNGVELTPIVVTTLKAPTQPSDITFTFFVGSHDHLVRRIETEVKLPDGTARKLVDTFTNIRADADGLAETLDFTPPVGATKVEQFSMPAVRAKVGAAPLVLAAGTKDIDGKDITFDQFKGKVTLVDFWATWCGPCIAELPNVKANYAKYHDKGFEIVGISLDQSLPPLTKYIKEKDMPWRQVWDGYWSGPIATSYNVRAIPSTLLIGKDGKIAAIGARGEALEPAIQAALAAG